MRVFRDFTKEMTHPSRYAKRAFFVLMGMSIVFIMRERGCAIATAS